MACMPRLMGHPWVYGRMGVLVQHTMTLRTTPAATPLRDEACQRMLDPRWPPEPGIREHHLGINPPPWLQQQPAVFGSSVLLGSLRKQPAANRSMICVLILVNNTGRPAWKPSNEGRSPIPARLVYSDPARL